MFTFSQHFSKDEMLRGHAGKYSRNDTKYKQQKYKDALLLDIGYLTGAKKSLMKFNLTRNGCNQRLKIKCRLAN